MNCGSSAKGGLISLIQNLQWCLQIQESLLQKKIYVYIYIDLLTGVGNLEGHLALGYILKNNDQKLHLKSLSPGAVAKEGIVAAVGCLSVG